MRKIFVTGAAGFIGSNLCKKLAESTDIQVIGIDNFDEFYDKKFKLYNLEQFRSSKNFIFHEADINDKSILDLISECNVVIHLAARAGVRPSIINPIDYATTNINGTINLLNCAVKKNVEKFIFASSSSVYGMNQNIPWREEEFLLPISPYAATKLAGEMYGNVYSSLYGLQFISLRFFTVYGPGQRPDLAIHKFFKRIYNNECIELYGNGTTLRDYTYIDDIVGGINGALAYTNKNFETFNLGNNHCVSLVQLIKKIEEVTGKKAKINFLPEQPGDVPRTYANISKAQNLLKYEPKTDIDEGLFKFDAWFRNFYGI